MKYIGKQSFLIVMTLIMGFGFASCSASDEETVIVAKTLEQYKTEYQTYITSEKELISTTVLGYNIGNFKATTSMTLVFDSYKSKYLANLVAAEATLVMPDLTIKNIIDSQSTLTANGKLFHDALWTSDRTALNNKIVEASALSSATVVGTAVGNVSQAAKDTLTAAITAAKAKRDSATYGQLAIDAETVTITNALIAFQAAIIK